MWLKPKQKENTQKTKQTNKTKQNQPKKKNSKTIVHGFDLCFMVDLFSIQSHDFVLTVNELNSKLDWSDVIANSATVKV